MCTLLGAVGTPGHKKLLLDTIPTSESVVLLVSEPASTLEPWHVSLFWRVKLVGRVTGCD